MEIDAECVGVNQQGRIGTVIMEPFIYLFVSLVVVIRKRNSAKWYH